jgi:hypothetical protein
MLGGIEGLRASGILASPREAGRGRRAKRGGRGARPRERAWLPLSLTLSPLSRGEGIGQCPGVATPEFHGRVKPFGALALSPLSRRGNRTMPGAATAGFHGGVKLFDALVGSPRPASRRPRCRCPAPFRNGVVQRTHVTLYRLAGVAKLRAHLGSGRRRSVGHD